MKPFGPIAAVAGFVGVFIVVGCGGGEDGDEGDGGAALVVDDGIAVVDAWVRPTPPTADEAALYVSVENWSAPDTAIIGADSPACMAVTPHATTISDDGIASMGAALDDQLALPAGASVTMAPHGLHLMCLGLVEPLVAGTSIDVTIDLADRDPVNVSAAVEQR